MYEKIKQEEIVQLYAENVFWDSLYNFNYNFEELKVLSVKLSEENFTIVENNGEKNTGLRKVMFYSLEFKNKTYNIRIIYDFRK